MLIRMTSLMFASCLTCLFMCITALEAKVQLSGHQEGGTFISPNAGDKVTLRCFYESNAVMSYWFKQTLGQKPRVISTFYKFDDGGTFKDEFQNDSRLSLETNIGIYHLKISDLRMSDSATYYCLYCKAYKCEFAEGIAVSVKGSGLVHQSVSGTIQTGGSVTLNCTVQTGTCDGEHSVYWFSKSHPGIVYSEEGRNDQCERKPDAQTHTCVYNLPMNNLNLSHAGTYYCAVASCGHMLFGNGTKLEFKNVPMVHLWHGASAVTTVLSAYLAFSLCMMSKRNCCKCSESQSTCAPPSAVSAKGDRFRGKLYYAALSINLTKRSRKGTDLTWSECVYSEQQ